MILRNFGVSNKACGTFLSRNNLRVLTKIGVEKQGLWNLKKHFETIEKA
jgi:hypothetical protein